MYHNGKTLVTQKWRHNRLNTIDADTEHNLEKKQKRGTWNCAVCISSRQYPGEQIPLRVSRFISKYKKEICWSSHGKAKKPKRKI